MDLTATQQVSAAAGGADSDTANLTSRASTTQPIIIEDMTGAASAVGVNQDEERLAEEYSDTSLICQVRHYIAKNSS